MAAYCKPCGCYFHNSLAEHNTGKKHIRKVAATRITNPVTPHQPPPRPSNLPNSQPVSLPGASSPAITVPTPVTSDPHVTVSHEGGLDFVVEGTEIAGRHSFPPACLAVLIEGTEVVSHLSIATVKHFPAPGTPESWCGLFDGSISDSHALLGSFTVSVWKEPRRILVSFQASHAGTFRTCLQIVFDNNTQLSASSGKFVVFRELRGRATLPGSHIGSTHSREPFPRSNRVDDHATLSTEEEDVLPDCRGTGISVSNEDGVDFGIVERDGINGLFAALSSVTINHAEGFPAVNFVEARIRSWDGSDSSGSSFRSTFEGASLTIRPGTERTVQIKFIPEFEGWFEATLLLIFSESQQLGHFAVSRRLRAIAGSFGGHKRIESLNQVNLKYIPRSGSSQQIPPEKIVPLSSPTRLFGNLPEFKLPPLVQEAVDSATFKRPYSKRAPRLIAALKPRELTVDTYAEYFTALLNVEEGHQQRDILDQRPFEVEVQERGSRYFVEFENKEEDLLPEVFKGDFLWLEDRQKDVYYDTRIANADVFMRGSIAVLKIYLRVPTSFTLCRGVIFLLRFRLNRVTLRHIKPIQPLSMAETAELPLINENIRKDGQQLQTVISVLQQPKGTVPFVIFGPPGTGKTSTVVESIMQLLRRDASFKILACTPSNAAADLLVERLAAAGLTVGQLLRVNAHSRDMKSIPEPVRAFSVNPECADLLAYRVVLSTCSSAGLLQTEDIPVGHFSHIVIDEAAQVEEPLALIPIAAFSNRDTNVILAGDPHQLGPVIKSGPASEAGLGRSYLERLMIVDLQRNRRSHGAIIAWPNRYLYKDRIHAYASPNVSHLLLQSGVLPQMGFPIVFHGVKGLELRMRDSPSYLNIHEASVVRDYCLRLTEDREHKIYAEEIGVIAPYKAQVRAIRELLRSVGLREVSVGSVEKFQGQERKVIIFATTRSNEEVDKRKAMGFLQNRRRMNGGYCSLSILTLWLTNTLLVAITRAQALLIVVGDPEVLGKDELWCTFLNYVCLRGGWTGKAPSWNPEEHVDVPGYKQPPTSLLGSFPLSFNLADLQRAMTITSCKRFVLHSELAKHRRGEDHRLNCGFGKWKADARWPASAIPLSPYPYVHKLKPSKKRVRRLATSQSKKRVRILATSQSTYLPPSRREVLSGTGRVPARGGETQHLSVSGEEGLKFKSEVGIGVDKKKNSTIPVIIHWQEMADNDSLTLVGVAVTGTGSRRFSAIASLPMKIKGKKQRIVHVSFVSTASGEWDARLVLRFVHISSGQRVTLAITRRLHGVATSSVDNLKLRLVAPQRPDDIKCTPEVRNPVTDWAGDHASLSTYEGDELPQLVLAAMNNATPEYPFEKEELRLINALRPRALNMDTYAQYFKALLNVEDAHQQKDMLNQPPFEVDVKKRDSEYFVEVQNKDEDLLPEVIVGNFLRLDDGKMTLNRVTLRRQYRALASSSAHLRRLLFPSTSDIKPLRHLSEAEVEDLPLVNENIRDDEQQLQTVVSVLQQPEGTVPFIISGPPGTGKTSVVVESIIQLLNRDLRFKILACTPSNAAADLLVERLAAAGLNADQLFRLNAYSRYKEDISEDVQSYSGLLQTENIPAGHFSHIVIDEAAQAEEPLALIPIAAFSNEKTNVILAGDPHQLGPVIKSSAASGAGLGKSYLERLMCISQIYGLGTQVGKTHAGSSTFNGTVARMAQSSHGRIGTCTKTPYALTRVRTFQICCSSPDVLPKKGFPVVFHGIKGQERRTRHCPSYFNTLEASVVRDYCQKLTRDRKHRICAEEIGVVAPYKAQVRTIRELLKVADLRGVSVGSVEQFQGQERKVIILATTRSNEAVNKREAMGFLQNRRRMTVAITRAQALLIVVGDPDVLGKDELWRTFLNYACLRGGWNGKIPSWKPKKYVDVPGYEVMPRPGGVVNGESYIGGKSKLRMFVSSFFDPKLRMIMGSSAVTVEGWSRDFFFFFGTSYHASCFFPWTFDSSELVTMERENAGSPNLTFDTILSTVTCASIPSNSLYSAANLPSTAVESITGTTAASHRVEVVLDVRVGEIFWTNVPSRLKFKNGARDTYIPSSADEFYTLPRRDISATLQTQLRHTTSPGTGKASTVAESIMQLLRRDASFKILACTPSNAAADLLVERLAAVGLTVAQLLRVNAYSRDMKSIPELVRAFSFSLIPIKTHVTNPEP
ncbi:P-loop containing nucleoside triphosphate hydrolase protein [Lactarius psammicola]|nr:P-loop containing nucleoside triphosphate hydrolase protein [Lactarius psammicola]